MKFEKKIRETVHCDHIFRISEKRVFTSDEIVKL